jgi:hypothetical protein
MPDNSQQHFFINSAENTATGVFHWSHSFPTKKDYISCNHLQDLQTNNWQIQPLATIFSKLQILGDPRSDS